jgi:hypothetical protein
LKIHSRFQLGAAAARQEVRQIYCRADEVQHCEQRHHHAHGEAQDKEGGSERTPAEPDERERRIGTCDGHADDSGGNPIALDLVPQDLNRGHWSEIRFPA